MYIFLSVPDIFACPDAKSWGLIHIKHMLEWGLESLHAFTFTILPSIEGWLRKLEKLVGRWGNIFVMARS